MFDESWDLTKRGFRDSEDFVLKARHSCGIDELYGFIPASDVTTIQAACTQIMALCYPVAEAQRRWIRLSSLAAPGVIRSGAHARNTNKKPHREDRCLHRIQIFLNSTQEFDQMK